MAKVFRIFRNSGDNKPNWFNSFEIGGGVVDSIEVQETDGKKMPTSIPSPFAQIDLVRTAFKNVCDEYTKGTALDSKKDMHRIVSNALDIGQIFFNIDKNSPAVSVDVWDKNQHLAELLNSGQAAHQHLGKTLELFLKSADAKSFNFDKLEKIFILKYNNRVIGGTSPKTLFFASADALKVGVQIYCGNDKMLDQFPQALYKRDKNFIKFLFYLQKQPDFSSRFPEVNDYLDLTLKEINKTDINFGNLLRQNQTSSDFTDLFLPQNQGIIVEPLPGFKLQKEIPQDPSDSDFIIETNNEIERPPLVLPVATYTGKLKYTNEVWNSSTEVPLFDHRPLDERTLPQVNDKYPYLTLGDFLSENIIRLPYKINSENFLCIDGYENLLLPLTSKFFDYFTAEELRKKNFLTIEERAGGVIEVNLNIPVKNNKFIPYSKKYNKSKNLQMDVHKTGNIVDVHFTMGIYPFVKSSNTTVDYTIAISENNSSKMVNELNLSDSHSNENKKAIIRERLDMDGLHSTYYLANENFDYISIETGNAKNVIIPKLKEHSNKGLNYHFAIDLGTTNTHIEYSTNQNQLPSSYKLENENFVYLRNQKIELRGKDKVSAEVCEQLLNQEVIHNALGSERYAFPFRSVLLENRSVDYNKATYLFSDVNIGFDYGKVSIMDHLREVTNLKWLHLNENFNNERIEKFIVQLLHLCKNKVLMTNGNIDQTRITWLFPTSMTFNQRSLFREIWNKQYKKIFYTNTDDHLSALPESIAPFYYYTGYAGLMNQTQPTASIDIGGGTTDITIFEKNEPKLISSFKFAGDAIFGDGYSNNIGNNGFVKRFYGTIKEKLDANQESTSTETKILEDILRRNRSIDVSNYFFTLKDNYHLKQENINIDYNSLLKNDQDTKLIFVLFYSALAYHLAQLMKSKGLQLPKHVLFSGTASKSINLLDSSLIKVNQLFNEIFNAVYDLEEAKIDLKIDGFPKIITAKGALKGKLTTDIDELIHTHLGTSNGSNEQSLSYEDVNETVVNEVMSNIKDFFELLDGINTRMNFNKSFGISSTSYQVFKETRNENLKDYLLAGLDERKKDVNDTASSIEETLFFYPFVGLLNELAAKVAELQH